KFEKAGLTPIPSRIVSVPSIKECPINIECRVRQQIALGSHIILMGEVMCVQVSPAYVTKSGKFSVEKARLIAFAHGEYFELGKKIGYFGFSVKKSKTDVGDRY
ncbi:TPA: flavin reductase family protein, partial [bacterium]|nr:flavin reductase family protein [bacterium]